VRAALLVVLGLSLLTGCGGSGPTRPANTRSATNGSATTGTAENGSATTGSASADTVRSARCMLWNVLAARERERLIRGLRDFFSQQLDTGARERLPADSRAYAAIDSYCRLPFARAFLLYRLYGNVAAFSGTH
jgi:hypothetical protein